MIIGITGIFGSGKTTVSQMFGEFGFTVINVDQFYQTLIEKNSELYREILSEFGDNIRKDDGSIDRNKLKKIVFNNTDRLKRLNSITHPYIIEKIQKKLKTVHHDKVVIDVPLLIEANALHLVDKVIVVSADYKKIKERLIRKGGYTRKEIKQITASQMPIKEKEKYADYVINNNSSRGRTKQKIEKILEELSL